MSCQTISMCNNSPIQSISPKINLVQEALLLTDIDTRYNQPIDKLTKLANVVNNSYINDNLYLFLWNTKGENIAHGRFPQLSGKGSVLCEQQLNNMIIAVNNILTPSILQNGILTVIQNSFYFGRQVSYPWVNNTIKISYVVSINIGDGIYILGA